MFLIIFLTAFSFPGAYAALESLYVTVYVDTSVDDARVLVSIRGQVSRANQSSVALASVSIQVDDRYESSVHIALVHSDSNGEYSDMFQLPSIRPTGDYTIYVTASKAGFQDAYAKLTFLVGNPFSIDVSPSSVTVTQGETATFRITIESRGRSFSPVHIEVANLPAHVSYLVSSNNQTVSSVVTLTLETSMQSEPGSHLFTIIGKSAEGESRANAEIVISEATAPRQYTWAAIPIAAAVVFAIAFYRRKLMRKKAPSSGLAMPEYLQGLALSPSTLLSLPDHLRKTAIIVCQLGEANAAEIAARSGRARAAESDYLNQLARMGLLKKKRKGRESYFSVESSPEVRA